MNTISKCKTFLTMILVTLSLQSNGALIEYSVSAYSDAHANTGQSGEARTRSDTGVTDFSLPGFDENLGTLEKVILSYDFSSTFSGFLRVYDPSAGVLSEESVHGIGTIDHKSALEAISAVPPGFSGETSTKGFRLECDQDSVVFDDILDPDNGQCSHHISAYSNQFSKTFKFSSQTDFQYFFDDPLHFSLTSIAVSIISQCDDDEDWCWVYSSLNSYVDFNISYQYTAFSDDTPQPVNPVPEPHSVVLFSIGLLGLAGLRSRLGG